MNLGPLQWKHRVLSTGSLGRSQIPLFYSTKRTLLLCCMGPFWLPVSSTMDMADQEPFWFGSTLRHSLTPYSNNYMNFSQLKHFFLPVFGYAGSTYSFHRLLPSPTELVYHILVFESKGCLMEEVFQKPPDTQSGPPFHCLQILTLHPLQHQSRLQTSNL